MRRKRGEGSKEDRDVGDEGRDEHEAQTVSKVRKKERAPPLELHGGIASILPATPKCHLHL